MRRRRNRKKHPLTFPLILLCAVFVCIAVPRVAERVAQPAGTGGTQTDTSIPQDGSVQDRLAAVAKQYPAAKKVKNNPEAYPQELIDLLLRNPETAEFVAGYPGDKKSDGKINLKKEPKQNGIPHLLQWDTRWGYESYGESIIALSGCGPTCLSMVYIGLTGDTSQTPKVLCDKSAQNGYYKKGAGTLWELMTTGAQQLGLDVKEIGLDEKEMKKELKDSHPLILSLRKGDFTTDGHFIVVTGVASNGEFQVLDPNSNLRSAQTWSMERLESQINNIWSFSN